MSTFPTLKSGAVAQYPAQRAVSKTTWIGQFVDGSEQRFRHGAAPLHKWTVNLSLLTEKEVVALREFIVNMSGRFESFSFTDPWDGTTYAHCSFDSDTNAIEWLGENNARTQLIIRENRS
ncbi:MAG TPA: DUF2460 domain-containing protein [Bryobacteraceae bacterium]|jgi:phage-related protein